MMCRWKKELTWCGEVKKGWRMNERERERPERRRERRNMPRKFRVSFIEF